MSSIYVVLRYRILHVVRVYTLWHESIFWITTDNFHNDHEETSGLYNQGIWEGGSARGTSVQARRSRCELLKGPISLTI